MFAFALTTATLSLLLLAAHFLRRGQVLPCAGVLGVLVLLLAVRRPWVPRVVQVLLALATVVWALTTVALVRQRLAGGGEAGRLAAILGAVIAVNVLAALLLGARSVTRHFAVAVADDAAR